MRLCGAERIRARSVIPLPIPAGCWDSLPQHVRGETTKTEETHAKKNNQVKNKQAKKEKNHHSLGEKLH